MLNSCCRVLELDPLREIVQTKLTNVAYSLNSMACKLYITVTYFEQKHCMDTHVINYKNFPNFDVYYYYLDTSPEYSCYTSLGKPDMLLAMYLDFYPVKNSLSVIIIIIMHAEQPGRLWSAI